MFVKHQCPQATHKFKMAILKIMVTQWLISISNALFVIKQFEMINMAIHGYYFPIFNDFGGLKKAEINQEIDNGISQIEFHFCCVYVW